MKKQDLSELYRKISFPTWTFPAALLVVGLLAYGIVLPRLGFYWDDWAKISVARLSGLGGYWAYYAEDRPLSSWTHILFTPLLGTQPFSWQVFQFILTLLAAWGLYETITRLWPQARWQAAAASFLFLVYPVFTQHPPAVTFHQQWIQYTLLFFSFVAMLAALRQLGKSQGRFIGLTLLSLLLSALQLSVTEYFASLELLRPLLLWIGLGKAVFVTASRKTRLAQTLKLSLPYFALIAFFLVWRFKLQPLSGGEPYRMVTLYGLFSEPWSTLRSLLGLSLQDSLHTLFSVWGPLWVAAPFESFTPFHWLALFLSMAAAGFVLIFLLKFHSNTSSSEPEARCEQTWHREAFWVGAAAFLLGMLPGWLTGRFVLEDFHSDRYALPAMFGACLLWIAAIHWITPARLQRALLAALLVAMSVGLQLRTGNEYRWLWTTETRFFWQLYWRAPHIQPGTALLTYQEIFPNQGLFSSSAALNLLYPHDTNTMQEDSSLPYWWYTLTPRYDVNRLPNPIELTFSTSFRSLHFQGGTPNTLILHYDPSQSNCLWVITTQDQEEPGLPRLVKAMSSISNTERILPEPANGWQPPTELFGPEPQHDWCYFYEKAELARQFQRWEEVADLGDQALAAGYSPRDSRANAPREWMPFVEAYAHLGRWSEAAELTRQTLQKGKEFQAPAALLWKTLEQSQPDSPDKQAALQVVQALINQ